MNDFYQDRTLFIVTKHQKETIIGPLFQRAFGWNYQLIELDTDQLGTFTGEIERPGDPLTTARKKIESAIEQANDLIIVSEGSFGPHPTIGFIAGDDELLLLFDKKTNDEFVVRHVSTQTNFSGQEIFQPDQMHDFLQTVGFPEHAVIVREEKEGKVVEKGIHSLDQLKSLSDYFFKNNKSFYLETDMRAMHNPSRQKVIAEACEKLIEKLKSSCPNCHHPGFDVKEVISGLPCMNCSYPTRSTLSYSYHCTKCGFSQEKKYPHGKTLEDPMYCDLCNP